MNFKAGDSMTGDASRMQLGQARVRMQCGCKRTQPEMNTAPMASVHGRLLTPQLGQSFGKLSRSCLSV